MRRRLFTGLITLSLLAACSTTPQVQDPQTPEAPSPSAQVPVDSPPVLTTPAGDSNAPLLAKTSKLSSALTALASGGLSAQSTDLTASGSDVRPRGNRLVSGDSTVTVDALSTGTPEELLATLQSLGMTSGSTYAGLVSGVLPVSALPAAAALPELRSMRLAVATTNQLHGQAFQTPSQGLTISQGDQAQRSDIARQKYRVSGAGVTVGALSDSFNCAKKPLTTAPDDVKNGDLPAGGVQVVAELDAPSCSAGASDEGRGMLQIVHDVAPASKLSFATAYSGQAGFANNILKLADAGADVIVDDVTYFSEPYFQDGVVAQAVDKVARQGVSYFSSAGNQARQSYEGAFRPSGQTFNGCELNDFDPGSKVDPLQSITIAPGDDVLIFLQWDQPFASVSRAGRGSASDVDLLLFDSKGKLLPTDAKAGQFPVSTDDNVGGDPVEAVQYFNTTKAPIKVNLAMTLCSGPAPKLLKWIDFDYGTDIEYDTKSPTSIGHHNAAGGAGVGAARFYRTPAFGQNPPLLESFSSAGGVPILFDLNGRPLSSPDLRQQPRFTAPDGGNTSFFGQVTFGDGTPVDGDAFPNFFGTSAAAPHAAGVAALMLDGVTQYGGASRPADIYKALAASSVDMKTPGYDADSGAGLIQADQALARILTTAP
ncbi:S8 family serine peptidase [Deinococcus humi]|uniref:Peptidase S8 n=1 Tax=Deinococcus humi TaxID=662880 RepID=A0A7W8JV11_9DEIO|nr:hypothetical protein [Deinococcus humi]